MLPMLGLHGGRYLILMIKCVLLIYWEVVILSMSCLWKVMLLCSAVVDKFRLGTGTSQYVLIIPWPPRGAQVTRLSFSIHEIKQ